MPGNVCELRNAPEGAVLLSQGGWMERAHMPKDAISRSPGGQANHTVGKT
jgi:DNA-binding NtrC family response regulator